jgi:molybdenum cofactor guanylyltransferase
MTPLLGAVLAGGQARRFGSDKAVALLDGVPLIDRACMSLQQRVSTVVVVGRDVVGYPSVADWPHAGQGPLGGLCGALRYGAAHSFAAIVSSACDIPLIPRAVLDELIGQDRCCYVADTPVIGLWPCSLANDLSWWLERGGNRSVRAWAASVDAVPVAFPLPIDNVNRPEDLQRLQTVRRP